MIGIAVRIVICIVCMRESFAWNPYGHIFARQKKFNATLLRNKQIVLKAYEPDDSNTVLEDGSNQKQKRSYSEENKKEDKDILYGPDVNSSKPPLDKKLYRQIILKKNGLRVLLISDVPAIGQKSALVDFPEDEKIDLIDQDDIYNEENNSNDEIQNSEFDAEMVDNDASFYTEEGEEEEDDDDDDDDGLRKAAASLVVGAGSYHDPQHAMGMAHFLEHMLFMGTKKYPTENAYDAFLSNNGGSDNACTGFEHTTYYFDVAQENLFQAMDMFAQFFIDPLLTPDAVDREINSINSEFELVKNADSCRLDQLLFYTSGKKAEEHPFAKFGWGNIHSLKDTPEKNNFDTVAELKKFFDQYYYATNMGLVVIGAYSLDELQDQVMKCFSDIPANPRVKSSLAPIVAKPGKKYPKTWDEITIRSPMREFGMPFAPVSLGKIYRTVPVDERHSLSIIWQLPPQQENWRSRPCDYLGHLLGHEGKGSLLSALKKKCWVTSCYAGMGYEGSEYASSHALFTVSFSLSEIGVEHWHEIVHLVYSYIGMIRHFLDSPHGLPHYLHEEFRMMNEVSYKFADEQTPADVVEIVYDFASDRCLPPERVLDGYNLLLSFDEKLVKSILDEYLIPSNARVDLVSSTFGRASDFREAEDEESSNATVNHIQNFHTSDTIKFNPIEAGIPFTEPYFGTRYWSHVIPTETIKSWSNAASPSLNAEEFGLRLPAENPFVPTKFDLKPVPLDESSLSLKVEDTDESYESSNQFPVIPQPLPKSRLPRVVAENPSLKMWWLQDRKFKRPIAELRVKIVTPNSNKDPLHRACAELLCLLWRDAVTEVSYQASLGGLEYSISDVAEGFTMRVEGFDDKLQALTNELLMVLFSFASRGSAKGLPSTIKEGRFDACLEILRRRYSNTGMEASSLSTDVRLECLIPNMWSAHAKARALQNIGIQTFNEIISSMLQSMSIEALYHGNCDQSDAEEAAKLIADMLSSHNTNNIPKGMHPIQYVTKIPLSKKNEVIRVPSKDKDDKNTAVEVYFQVGPDNVEERMLLDLLAQIMYEPLYDQVRTKDQFGYSVSVSARWTYGIMGLYFKVVTSSKTVDEVEERLEKFLIDFRENLTNMSADVFIENLVGLVKNKLQKYNSLEEECSELWSEIMDSRYDWQCWRREALSLQNVTKPMVLDAFDKWFSPLDKERNRCKRRLVTFAVEGSRETYDYKGDDIDERVDQFQKEIGCETWGKINLNI